MIKTLFLFILVLFNDLTGMCLTEQHKEYIYVGTYNETGKPGIFVFEFNRTAGTMKLVQELGGMIAPSYLEIHPNNQFLYSVNRNSVIEGKRWGSVSSYKINQENGTLEHLNDQPTFGVESCHVNLDSKGRLVFVANYGTGNLTVFPVNADGTLDAISDSRQHYGHGKDSKRQGKPRVHQSVVSADDRFLFVSDLGIDKVKVYSIDYTTNRLTALPGSDGILEGGSGPRHFAIHQNGKFAYAINELSSTVTLFSLGETEAQLTPVQTISALPEDYEGTSYCADIHIDPSGKFLYGSNRGHNSLAIFSIDQNTGRLSVIDYQSIFGDWPRNFLIDPKGEYIFVANQNSNNIVLFKIDPDTGKLHKTDVEVSVPGPVCLKILEL